LTVRQAVTVVELPAGTVKRRSLALGQAIDFE
jgi:hypothetical protein